MQVLRRDGEEAAKHLNRQFSDLIQPLILKAKAGTQKMQWLFITIPQKGTLHGYCVIDFALMEEMGSFPLKDVKHYRP